MCDALISDRSVSLCLVQITYKKNPKLHLVFNAMTHFVRDGAVFCSLTTLKCVFAAAVHTEAVDGAEWRSLLST